VVKGPAQILDQAAQRRRASTVPPRMPRQLSTSS